MGRYCQFAVVSSLMAMEDAGIEVNKNVDENRIGVWIGSGIVELVNLRVNIKIY